MRLRSTRNPIEQGSQSTEIALAANYKSSGRAHCGNRDFIVTGRNPATADFITILIPFSHPNSLFIFAMTSDFRIAFAF